VVADSLVTEIANFLLFQTPVRKAELHDKEKIIFKKKFHNFTPPYVYGPLVVCDKISRNNGKQ